MKGLSNDFSLEFDGWIKVLSGYYRNSFDFARVLVMINLVLTLTKFRILVIVIFRILFVET